METERWLNKLYESVNPTCNVLRAKFAHSLFPFQVQGHPEAVATYLQTLQARASTPNSLLAHKNSLHIHSGKQQHYAFCYTATHGWMGEKRQGKCATSLYNSRDALAAQIPHALHHVSMACCNRQ